MDKFQLPKGVGDSLPEYMYRRIRLENTLSELFFLHGYDPIDTSVIENAKTYCGAVGAVSDDKLFQFQDTDGSMVVLRADMTLPLSRIAATKLSEEYPLRLSYVSPSYNLTVPRNRDREFRQAGVELFGVSGAEGDQEVISVAIEALNSVGLMDFQIDIGQVGIVKGILQDVPEEKQKQIVAFIDKKNMLNADLGLDSAAVEALNSVVMLYGEEEVLEKAEHLLQNYPASLNALNNLKQVYALLKSKGYDKYISFDLGLVNSYSYYSGVVFKGMTALFGASILGGGRYDKLLSNYGKSVPATGMAIGIRDLLTALERQKNYKTERPLTDIAVGGVGAGREASMQYATKMRGEGLRVQESYFETKAELLAYAQRVGALRAVFFSGRKEQEELI